jgi:hypothetical protein
LRVAGWSYSAINANASFGFLTSIRHSESITTPTGTIKHEARLLSAAREKLFVVDVSDVAFSS